MIWTQNIIRGIVVNTNPKGNLLFRISCTHQLTVEASSNPTHIPRYGYIPDILDLFITKNLSLDRDPRTLSELSSDHQPVMLEIPFQINYSPKVSAKINWLFLKYHLENFDCRYSKITSPDSLDSALLDLNFGTISATQKATSTFLDSNSTFRSPLRCFGPHQIKKSNLQTHLT